MKNPTARPPSQRTRGRGCRARINKISLQSCKYRFQFKVASFNVKQNARLNSDKVQLTKLLVPVYMLTFVNEMRGRAPASTSDEDQEEKEQHPDQDEDHHDDLHRGRAHQQAVQGGATLIVLYRHICRCANIALISCKRVYNCPLLFSFNTQMIK